MNTLKKLSAVLLVLTYISVMTISVAAAGTEVLDDIPANNAVYDIEDAELVDDDTTQDKGGSGKPIAIVDGYGCGYSSLNDKVVLDVELDYDIASVALLFGYGNNDKTVTTIQVDVDGEEVGVMEIPYTGGWTIDKAKWVSIPVEILAGEHEVSFTFTNEKSGSFSKIAFSADYYLDLYVFTDAEVIDDASTQDKGGSGKPIQIMEEYGCGYSSLNDVVAFYDVDFGANGASGAAMRFGYGADAPTTIAVYIDDLDSDPACEMSITNTGAWTIAGSGYLDLPIEVPAGVHDIYVKFTNEMSGSLSELHFVEAIPEETAAASPSTFDGGAILVIAAILSGAGCVVAKKNK